MLLTEIENESGEQYRLDYTPSGLVRQETGFDGRRTAYAYDLNGHLLEKTEFGDDDTTLVTTYQRDATGRLLVKTLPDGVKVEYCYDSLGRLVSVDDGHDHPLEFEDDQQDRLVTEHQAVGARCVMATMPVDNSIACACPTAASWTITMPGRHADGH